MKNLFTLVLVTSFLSVTALAAQKKEASKAAEAKAAMHDGAESASSGNPLSPNQGSDSCGIGWQVTNKKSFLGTTTRGTTNSVVHPSFGITSGTMGCQKHTFSSNEVQGVKYAATNYDELKVEMAMGQGEYLQALSRTMGCSDAVAPAFGKMTQEKFETLTKGTSLDFYENLKSQVKASTELNAACGV